MFSIGHEAHYYEHSGGTKFYELVRLDFIGECPPGPARSRVGSNASLIIKRWGKIGAKGQVQTLWYPHVHQANSEWTKLKKERVAARSDGRYVEKEQYLANCDSEKQWYDLIASRHAYRGFEWQKVDGRLFHDIATAFRGIPEPGPDFEEAPDAEDIISGIVAEVGDEDKEITSTYGAW